MTNRGQPFLVLAASDIKESELRAFFMEVNHIGVSDCIKRVRHLRDVAEGMPGYDASPSSRSGYDAGRLEEFGSTVQKVRDLLLVEGRLTKAQASRALYSDLVRKGVPQSHIPPYQKIAFDLWLARLCDAISPSQVLHVASRLRNDLVHGKRGPSNWPLTEPDE